MRGARGPTARGAGLAAGLAAVALVASWGAPTQDDGAGGRRDLGPRAVPDSPWLAELLAGVLAADERFAPLAADPAAHRLQVLVSEVVDGPDGARLERHGYRVDAEYVYPASAIKTLAAVAAVVDVGRRGLPLDTPLVYHPLFDDEELEDADPSNLASGAITVRHEVRKLFLVSDNRAYNRLYELVGHRELNALAWDAGLRSTRVLHRLSEFRSVEDQRRTPRVELRPPGDEPVVVPERTSTLVLDNDDVPGIELGRAFASGGVLREGPTSFREKNWASLVDLQDLVALVVRPELCPDHAGFELGDAARAELVRAMSEYPPDSDDPRYDPAAYPRDWGVFLLPGLERVVPPERLFVANKIGRAYGFSVEDAYVEDRGTGRAFLVTAVLYTNANGVLNDGVYEYAELADPFLSALGEALARALLVDAPPAGPSDREPGASER